MKVAFLPIAQRELDDVFSWYEQQAVGLGYEFLDTFDQTLRMVCSYPEINPQVQENIRRCLLNRFPYAVYYGVNEETIIIIALAHLRRKPDYWIQRAKEIT